MGACCCCVNVGPTEIGLTERRMVGDPLSSGRSFALTKGEVGNHAAYLNPGLSFVAWPFVVARRKIPFTVIGPNQLGIISATDGAPLPAGRILAEDAAGEHHQQYQNPVGFLEHGGIRGEQLRFLTTGQFKLNTLLFRVKTIDKTSVPNGMVGLVYSRDGAELEPGGLVGRSVRGHNNFQQAEVFLRNGGQKGPQIDFLRPGTYNIHTGIFNVTLVPAISVAVGHIAVVEALGGAPMRHGDVVADTPDGIDNFQDGEGFIRKGGMRGPQTTVLCPGVYYINTSLFSVSFFDQTVVHQGQVAVLISNHGKDPSNMLIEGTKVGPGVPWFPWPTPTAGANEVTEPLMPLSPGSLLADAADAPDAEGSFCAGPASPAPTPEGDANKTVGARVNVPGEKSVSHKFDGMDGLTKPQVGRHVVPSGFRGIQRNTLGPGRYNINPRVNQIVIFPTTTRSVEWARVNSGMAYNGLNTCFDPFEVVSNDGFSMKVEVRCQYRVLPENAPYVIAKLGSIEELEKNVIDPQIDGIFRAEVSKSPAIAYQQRRAEEQKKAEEEVRADLAKYKVEVVSVMITNIVLPSQLMETTQKKNLAEQQRSMFDAQKLTEERRIEFEKTKASAENQKRIIEAQAGIEVSTHEATQKTKEAEGEAARINAIADAEANRIKRIGVAEADVIHAKGEATGEAYKIATAALGADGLSKLEVVKCISEAGLRITPDIQVSDGKSSHGGGLIQSIMTGVLQRTNPRIAPEPAR